MSKQYYVVHQEDDLAIGYTFLDPKQDFAHVLVLRPTDDPIDDGFESVYSQALKGAKGGPEGIEGFRFPDPVYRTPEQLAASQPDLGSRMGAAGLAELLTHVGIDEDVHGRLHDRYSGWADPKPFERLKVETRFWSRRNGRRLPDMAQVVLPSYDTSKTTLTYFTMRRIDAKRSYTDPKVSHYKAWKHVVDLGAKPWRFEVPEEVAEVDVRARETEVVDAAFGGPVEVFATLSLEGSSRLLLNLGPPGVGKRFVVVDGVQDVRGAYDTLSAMLAAHPDVDRAAFVTRLAQSANDFSYAGGYIISDAQAWRDAFGQEKRERVGSPKFTLHEDLSEYRVIPAIPAPPFADQVADPKLDGNELVLYARVEGRVAAFRWDTRTFTEGECFTKTNLGRDPSADRGRSRPR